MKTIGREVFRIPVKEGNPRNGEGSLIRLKDGRIMFAYTEYCSATYHDDATARLAVTYSSDEGETWTSPLPLIEKDDGALNYMSPSLIRLNGGDLGIVYLRKERHPDDRVSCMPTFARSSDEGAAFSKGVTLPIPLGYYCAVNDSVIRQKNGRILVPMSGTSFAGDPTEDEKGRPYTCIRIAYSDDDGASWDVLPYVQGPDYSDTANFAEPGVYEHEDGTLWTWIRSGCGFQYNAYSSDGGLTWSTLAPNLYFTSPEAPMRIKRLGKLTVAVFDPDPFTCTNRGREIWGGIKRTPLVCAVCRDDGASFDSRGKCHGDVESLKRFTDCCYLLEDDRSKSYCYPSLTEVEGGFLAAYYHSGPHEFALTDTCIRKVMLEELN